MTISRSVARRRFDPTLFHYLTARLGPLRSRVAIDYALGLLSQRPEETAYVLDYLTNFLEVQDVVDRVLQFAASEEAIYEYQMYQIVRWMTQHSVRAETGLRIARAVMVDRAKPLWLRSQALAYVGLTGDTADLDSIEALYPSTESELERAIILCSLRRMPRQRRNSVYGRHGGDGLLNSLAVRWCRQ